MYSGISVDLSDMLLSISEALDLASPSLSQHQLRVAFVAWELAEALDLSQKDKETLFIAALLHDVGALSPEDKLDVRASRVESMDEHCAVGAGLLAQGPDLAEAAEVVRLHHATLPELEVRGPDQRVALLAQIVLLADTLERSMDRRIYVLHQHGDLTAEIRRMAGCAIDRRVVEAFLLVSGRDEFWLNLVSPRLFAFLSERNPCRRLQLDLDGVRTWSLLVREIIDFRSPFTATHSAGVSASAGALARAFGLPEPEARLLEIAGNLHDLGKMVVPNAILEKAGPLSDEEFAVMRQHTYHTYLVLNSMKGLGGISEWAAFHHEKLDGSGYPFRIGAGGLSIGSRIMAVADMCTALAEDRPYRQGMRRDEIIDVLRDGVRRGLLDKAVVATLESRRDDIIDISDAAQREARNKFSRHLGAEAARSGSR